MKKIDLPYMRITQVNELLKKLSPSFIERETISSTEISKAIGVKKATINNMVTTCKALGMIQGRGKYSFTDSGKKYIKHLLRNSDYKSREILKAIVSEIDYIVETRQWLEQKGKLKIEDIGNQLALKFDQKWEHPLTAKAYGAAISSIIDFIGDASYRTGTLFLKKAEYPAESIPAPDVYINRIFEILTALFPDGRDFHELSEITETSEKRLSSEILPCLELGLVERPTRGFYRLMDSGKSMISPVSTEQNKSTIFRERLLRSRYSKTLRELTDEITVEKMGEILKYSLNRGWASQTSKTFGSKFISWLIYAGIAEKKGRKYIISDRKSLGIKYDTPLDAKADTRQRPPIKSVDPISYYMLGKYIGHISNPNSSKEVVTEAVSNIIAFCREDHRLKDVLEGWKEDYGLYPDLKDPRIFLRDIKALEKAMGVKL